MKIKRILVSQPQPTSEKSPYYAIMEKYGVKIDFRPFIKVEPVEAKEFRQQRINILDFPAVIFTAKTAIDHFFRLCGELRITVPEEMRYYCVSESIALYLQKYITYRKRKVFFSPTGKIEDLTATMQKHPSEKYLLVVSDMNHKDDLIHFMEENNAPYEKAIMYRTVGTHSEPDEVYNYDMLIFFSPSGIASLQRNFPNFVQNDIAIGCFGPTTVHAVKEAGLRLDMEVPTPEFPSMTAALEHFIKENHKASAKK